MRLFTTEDFRSGPETNAPAVFFDPLDGGRQKRRPLTAAGRGDLARLFTAFQADMSDRRIPRLPRGNLVRRSDLS